MLPLSVCKQSTASIQIARELGLLLDPIYSLAAWEVAVQNAAEHSTGEDGSQQRVCMLHCGGLHGLYGLAQRYPADF